MVSTHDSLLVTHNLSFPVDTTSLPCHNRSRNMFTPELRRRLSEISRGKPADAPEDNKLKSSQQMPEYACAYDFRGSEVSTEHGLLLAGNCMMSEMLSEAAETAGQLLALSADLGRDLSRMVFLDIETCGLANVPVFLVGTMQISGDDFAIRQFLARDYSEEKSLLASVQEVFAGCEGLITFNGKTFDVPFLRDRMVHHRLECPPIGEHYDLLAWARPKWRRTLPNCKLQTLESHVCNRYRTGDIPGSEIPGLYHKFVRDRDYEPMLSVLKHNAMDLMTMAELLPKIVR
jgi:uncharacterized protein YprB with RNaseH-like and TPR domain